MATLTTDADVLIGRPGKETAVSHMLPSLVKTQNGSACVSHMHSASYFPPLSS